VKVISPGAKKRRQNLDHPCPHGKAGLRDSCRKGNGPSGGVLEPSSLAIVPSYQPNTSAPKKKSVSSFFDDLVIHWRSARPRAGPFVW
jgi:hypothetical protein